MTDTTGIIPPFRHKLLFWVILGTFSMFFAEVVSGATMIPFNPWALIVTTPLYTLHLLILAFLMFHYGYPIVFAIVNTYFKFISRIIGFRFLFWQKLSK